MKRVLLLMDHKENRRLLADWLATRYTVLPEEADQAVDEQYDLGILDGTALDRLADAIQARKKREEPVFLPFLLVTPRQDVGLVTWHLWKSIDEVIRSPIDKVESQARMEVLLRVRRQSVDLHDATRQRLAEVVNELAEANRRKDEFLAMLAHELRNPLAPIRNGLYILRMPNAGATDRGRVVQMMEQEVQHLTRMVDDLLDVSRITRGKIQLRKETIDLASAVAHAVETVRPLMEAQRHELSVSLPPESVHLEADPTRLEQVLCNLLNNAAKYTERGGRIDLIVERDGSEVAVRVLDTGIGISAELLPRIFDLFTQADHSLARSQGGLGIGLTLVRKLAEIMGGTVTAHSDGPGKGSQFQVRLPALPQPVPQEQDGPMEEARSSKRPLRVLVVEDVEDVAEMLVLLLKMWGHDVRAVYDGAAALVAARTYHPDVVLLDIGLPGLNGYDVARQLRQEASLRKPLIAAVTGYGSQEDRRRSWEAGFDHHMVKPVDPHALKAFLACAESLRRGPAPAVDQVSGTCRLHELT